MDKNSITRSQLAAFYAILNQRGLTDDKEDIVLQISNNRTRSASQLTFKEASSWLKAMNTQAKPADPRQRMINHLIAMATEIGFVRWQSKVDENGKLVNKRNYDDLHAWIEKYGYLKKHLNKYTYEELPKLVSQFQAVYGQRINNQKK